MTRIFISYSRRDKHLAEYIAAQLRIRGADVFIDYQKLIAGENFIGRLGGEIARADYFVLLVSPRSVASKWVQAEVAWAFTNEKPIVPVLLEAASVKDLFFLINLEQVDFTRWSLDGNVSDALYKLTAALNLPLEVIQQTQPEPVLMSQPTDETAEEPEPHMVTFAREDLSELFFTATEVADDDPEQAIFLYQQVIKLDPDFLRGQAPEFINRQTERLKPLRLERLLGKAEAAFAAKEWDAVQQLAGDILGLDPNNPDANRLIALCEANLPCEPVYKQAEIAAGRGRWKAVLTLLHDIRQTCPDYGDPLSLGFAAITKGSGAIPMLEWCEIPSGMVVVENKTYSVAGFHMAKYPITNAQFQLFIDDPSGYRNPFWWDFSPQAQEWRKQYLPPVDQKYSGDTLPRVNVCWYEAVAFCHWLSVVLGYEITLPTEQQWQRATQGDDEREYPWGSDFDAGKCNIKESGIGRSTPVDHYPAGASPYGVMDMAGNVWEWCLNVYASPEGVKLIGDGSRSLRGGSFNLSQHLARSAYRNFDDSHNRSDDLGFRVCCAAPIQRGGKG